MGYDIVRRGSSTPAVRIPSRLNRRLTRIEEDALVRATEVRAKVAVGRAAQTEVTRLALGQNQLQGLLGDDHNAKLWLSMIGEATVSDVLMGLLDGM